MLDVSQCLVANLACNSRSVLQSSLRAEDAGRGLLPSLCGF